MSTVTITMSPEKTADGRAASDRGEHRGGAERSAAMAARLTSLGLAAVAVDRCPVRGCEVCDRSTRRAA